MEKMIQITLSDTKKRKKKKEKLLLPLCALTSRIQE